ncbi:MAG: hypothetical protein O3A85_00720 [Proteobacteria bacterium]|nr:hypothetical protein [Pseudomonadota bacterium]
MTPARGIIFLAATLAFTACAETSRSVTPSVTAAPAFKPTVAAIPPVAPTPKAPPKKVYPSPSRLSGLDRDQVTGLLGAPGFKRLDEPALIWQYRSAICALDIFLYRGEIGDIYTVRHFEARSRGIATVSEKDCFVGLLIAHEQRS